MRAAPWMLLLGALLGAGCVVTRTTHAEALRARELAEGRLVDAQRERAREAASADSERAVLTRSRDALQAERDTLQTERDALLTVRADLAAALAARTEESESLRLGRDAFTGGLGLASLPSASAVSPADALFVASRPVPALSAAGAAWVAAYAKDFLSLFRAQPAGLYVLITGHSDGASDDLAASGLMAAEVARALVKEGVPGERLRIIGAGHGSPACTESRAPDCIARNRRVSLTAVDAH